MSSPRIGLQMINNMWDRLRGTLKCVLSRILIRPHPLARPQFLERSGEERGASWVIRGVCGCHARGSQLLRWEHKGPLIECYHVTDTPGPSEPPLHPHPHLPNTSAQSSPRDQGTSYPHLGGTTLQSVLRVHGIIENAQSPLPLTPSPPPSSHPPDSHSSHFEMLNPLLQRK